jgi:hypothetical protein
MQQDLSADRIYPHALMLRDRCASFRRQLYPGKGISQGSHLANYATARALLGSLVRFDFHRSCHFSLLEI